ncbi:MAG: hypothetical protein IPM74_18160 [Crocinitomicaceae bacterium]|nr:hypothetical protein [Crocinitomicaceae bacterium]
MIYPPPPADMIIHQRDWPKLTQYWLTNGVFRTDVKESAFLEADDFLPVIKAKMDMINGQDHCSVFICPKFGNISSDARKLLATPEANLHAMVKAIVTPNLGTKILAEFFIAVNRPPVPHKAFSDIDQAMLWVKLEWKKIVDSRNQHAH